MVLLLATFVGYVIRACEQDNKVELGTQIHA